MSSKSYEIHEGTSMYRPNTKIDSMTDTGLTILPSLHWTTCY